MGPYCHDEGREHRWSPDWQRGWFTGEPSRPCLDCQCALAADGRRLEPLEPGAGKVKDMKVLRELPPAPIPGRYVQEREQSDMLIAEAAASYPGEWCQIQTYRHASSASHAAKVTFPKRYPDSPVEFASRTIDGEHAVWARWPKTGDQ